MILAMANYFLINGWIILFLFCTTFITFSRGASVFLRTEGGVSLVGPHCPAENVTLFCEGVDLSSLRWRYNGNINIKTYFPTGISSPQPTQLEFFMVQLLTDQQNANNGNLANFSSSLTVQFSQLEINNVTEISCGAPGVSRVEPVNVSIIEPGVPNDPTITNVTAVYQSGELKSVEVTWKSSDDFCPSFGLSLSYEVNITTYDSVISTSCNETSCVISLNNLTRETREIEYTVSIKAENEVGSSGLAIYPYSIGYQIQRYFIPEALTKDGQLFGRCTTAQGFAGSNECSVQYTTDPMYRDLSDEITEPLNTDFSLLKNPVPETTYYFLFTAALVNDTLQIIITDRIVFKFSAQEGIPGYGITLIVIVVIVFTILLVIVLLIAAIFFRVKKQTSKNCNEIENNSPEESIEELIEEIKELTVSVEGYEFNKIVTGSGVFRQTKDFTVYRIVVKYGDRTATVQRSVSEFEEMYKKVEEAPTYKSKAGQMKQIFNTKTENFDREYLVNCQTKLDKFIDNLLRFPNILEFSPVQKFLGLGDDFLEELKENNITELQQKIDEHETEL